MNLKYILIIPLFLSLGFTYGQEQAELLAHWKVDTIPGSRAYNNAYNEVWGVVVNDVEYGIIGSTLGTHVFDLSDPSNPIEIFFVKGATSSTQIVHRDYHDYKGYLYAVADEGRSSTLQIIDISTLPESIDIVYDSGDLIFRSHNIFIDTVTAKLYSCISDGNTLDFSPLRVFDISDPVAPKVLGDYRRLGNVSISQVHDAYINNDLAYLNCGPRGLIIANFEDMNEPQVHSYIASRSLELAGYNHSGWLSNDGTTYYVSDEEWGEPIKVLDVRDLENVELSMTIDAGSISPLSIAHNQVVAGDYLYISYYYDGLQVYDISDPLSPERVMNYPTSQIPHRENYEGSWGVYPLFPSGIVLVSDMQEGLFILKGPDYLETSVDEIGATLQVQTYPNPCGDVLHLDLPEDISAATIRVLDSRGVEFKSQKVSSQNSITLDVSRLETNSIYFVEIETANHKIISRFAKM